MLNTSVGSQGFITVILPGTHSGKLELRIVPDQGWPSAISVSAHALQNCPFRGRVEAVFDPVVIDFVNLVCYAAQCMVSAPRSISSVTSSAR